MEVSGAQRHEIIHTRFTSRCQNGGVLSVDNFNRPLYFLSDRVFNDSWGEMAQQVPLLGNQSGQLVRKISISFGENLSGDDEINYPCFT